MTGRSVSRGRKPPLRPPAQAWGVRGGGGGVAGGWWWAWAAGRSEGGCGSSSGSNSRRTDGARPPVCVPVCVPVCACVCLCVYTVCVVPRTHTPACKQAAGATRGRQGNKTGCRRLPLMYTTAPLSLPLTVLSIPARSPLACTQGNPPGPKPGGHPHVPVFWGPPGHKGPAEGGAPRSPLAKQNSPKGKRRTWDHPASEDRPTAMGTLRKTDLPDTALPIIRGMLAPPPQPRDLGAPYMSYHLEKHMWPHAVGLEVHAIGHDRISFKGFDARGRLVQDGPEFWLEDQDGGLRRSDFLGRRLVGLCDHPSQPGLPRRVGTLLRPRVATSGRSAVTSPSLAMRAADVSD